MESSMSNVSTQSNEKIGKVAQHYCGVKLPVTVMQSAKGFYLGTISEGVPISRESTEYFRTHDEATQALESGKWLQRIYP
jgi:hypothetical protein